MSNFFEHPAQLRGVLVFDALVHPPDAKRLQGAHDALRRTDRGFCLGYDKFACHILVRLFGLRGENARVYPSKTLLSEIPRRWATSIGSSICSSACMVAET